MGKGTSFLVSKETDTILKTYASSIHMGDKKTYHFVPFWFEEVAPNTYKAHRLGNIPKELELLLKHHRMDANGNFIKESTNDTP